jgi:hypothetical protein
VQKQPDETGEVTRERDRVIHDRKL